MFVKERMSSKQLTQIAMFAAISIVLMYFIRFPIIPVAPFLEYTPAEIPVMMAALLFGPGVGLILTVVVAVVQGMTVSAHSGIIGIIMNIFSTGSYVLAAGLIYHYSRNKNTKKAVIAMLVGIAATTVVMVFWNIIFTPIFMGVPRQVVIDMLVPAFIPFNLIRAGVNSVIAFVIWRAVGDLLLKQIK